MDFAAAYARLQDAQGLAVLAVLVVVVLILDVVGYNSRWARENRGIFWVANAFFAAIVASQAYMFYKVLTDAAVAHSSGALELAEGPTGYWGR